jgi:hypothetical protein
VDGPKVVAERAFADLCGLELVRLRSGQLYRYLKPLQPPFKISVDELERWVWGFNVMAEVEP